MKNPITLFSDQMNEPSSMHVHTYVSDSENGNSSLTALGIFNEGGQPLRIHFKVDDFAIQSIAGARDGDTVELEVDQIGIQLEGSIEREELLRMFAYILHAENINTTLMGDS